MVTFLTLVIVPWLRTLSTLKTQGEGICESPRIEPFSVSLKLFLNKRLKNVVSVPDLGALAIPAF